ncbi:RNaseH domain-containing protein [Micromonospora sp. WMMD1076]|uniref:RNaseH domain-containing protein n=1 Tax=Micromonospora sp. WMMD1076 TaxID=3016103 RepID=UPI00249A6C6D|nr:RNaseH domain-containing protein [Micromonospora sp. WMMD1076]WFF08717.1 RNaseH domain-containing protein [Micromonospora sp. WMMD1076]
MLSTLAYRIPREHLTTLLGTVTAYPLTAGFQDAWATLPGGRPPFASLATGLMAATGRPVRLFGERDLAERERDSGAKALLLTTDCALDHRLRVAVRAWERHVRAGGPAVLADLIPDPEEGRCFTDFVEFRAGAVPVAPNWVFRVAAWQIARTLAARPLPIDSRAPVRLRMDTFGQLLAWAADDLIGGRDGTAFAMTTVSVRLTTRPGIEDFVLAFDAHQSLIDPRGKWYGALWVERADDAPILDVPVRRRKVGDEWHAEFDPALASILSACQLAPLRLPDEFPACPAEYRPKLRHGRSDLGSGPGPRFMLRLHEYLTAELPLLAPLTYERDGAINLPERVEKFPAEGVRPESVAPTGYKKVTIVCLYRTAEARDRMLDQLDELTGYRPAADGAVTRVHERLDLLARYCPDLVDHASPNRAAALDSLHLPDEDDHLVVAWVETEYHPGVGDREIDAKPHLRRLFGHLGIPTQFLATEPAVLPSGAPRATEATQEHAARAALRDLLRSAGVLDERVRSAVARIRLRNRLDRRTLLLGIHARAQRTSGRERPFVITMIAILADPDALDQWRVLMYSDRRREWAPVADALTDFHAGAIGVTHLGRTGEKAGATRVEIERRLMDLVSSDLQGVPVVVFVAAETARAIWPGLQNVRFGNGPLPGDRLRAEGLDVAVVRMNADMAELGRPVTRVNEGRQASDPLQPAAPGNGVYRLVESAEPSWLLAGKSRSLAAKGGRTGAQYTRWTLPDHLRHELGVPWHSYTAREILVVRSGLWEPAELAALAARLCEQPIAWDGRTLVPAPLHLSIVADQDHPDYRNSEPDDE